VISLWSTNSGIKAGVTNLLLKFAPWPILLVIGFMTWMWRSIIVALVGAKLDAEIDQKACESTTGPPKPLGQRGAKIADTIGPAKA
jgi:hypothetical protein